MKGVGSKKNQYGNDAYDQYDMNSVRKQFN